MSILVELKERIRRQFGPGHFREDDYSFLQPGGNNHMVQFLYKSFPDEYWELDEWNRHHLLLIDISADLGVQFSLDDDGQFAVLQSKGKGEQRQVQAIIDLRDDLLAIVYYFGDIRKCARVNQQLVQNPLLHPCFIDSDMLFRIIDIFEKVIGVEYHFEQSPTIFLQPVIVKGQLKGDLVHQIFSEYSERFSGYLNLCVLTGFLTDGAQGSITLHSEGTVRTDACRLSSFIEVVTYVLDFLTKKYQTLTRHFLAQWEEHPQQQLMEMKGTAVEIELPFAVEKMDGLIRYLTNGSRDMPFLGISERISRKLWMVKSTDIQTTEQIEFEVSERLIRVFIRDRRAIPLYDKIERFLRRQISASLENWNH